MHPITWWSWTPDNRLYPLLDGFLHMFHDKRVALTEFDGLDVSISTVFLSLDHQHGDGPPLLFETMVFGGGLDGECARWSTLEEALAGHEDFVTAVQESEGFY